MSAARYDVVIIGAGVTGLSAALHLKARGIAKIAVSDDSRQPSFSTLGAGSVFGGQLDNFTRVSHAHGDDLARAFWAFGDHAYDEFQRFAADEGLVNGTHRHLRLITSATELTEAQEAVAAMTAAGFLTKILEPKAAGIPLTNRVLAVQDDGPRSMTVDPRAVHQRLRQKTANLPHFGRATAVEEVGGGVRVQLDSGTVLEAEIAVIAAHLGTGVLIPELKDALVGVADQWSAISFSGISLPVGMTYSAQHTHEWGVVTAPGLMRVGGGRYLRPMAGIEATIPTVLPAIAPHLRDKLAATFSGLVPDRILMSNGYLDINPCDELPIAGPMYGRGRLLVAAGFFGLGLSQGFFAGRCLADLVKDGRADQLPRQLWPERLRSIEA